MNLSTKRARSRPNAAKAKNAAKSLGVKTNYAVLNAIRIKKKQTKTKTINMLVSPFHYFTR